MRTRESRYVTVARLAYQLAQQALPRYSHPKSPRRYNLPPQRVACVLMKFYLNVSYRDAEEWLLASDQVQQVLELKAVPDYSTLIRTYGRLRQVEWDRLLQTLLNGLGVEEAAISVDTTNFRLSQASAYYMTRSGRQYREWIKGGYAVGIDRRLILGWRSGRGSGYDQPYLEPLRRQARRYGRQQAGQRAWILLGDMGFDGKTTRCHDLIPVQPRRHVPVAEARKARHDLVSAAILDGFYGQRWQSETVNSVIKRKFGDTICSRSLRRQRREPLVKGLVYNLHVLWHPILFRSLHQSSSKPLAMENRIVKAYLDV
jgi:hypothetical protein